MYHQRLIIAALTAEILNRNALCPFTRLDINNHPVYQPPHQQKASSMLLNRKALPEGIKPLQYIRLPQIPLKINNRNTHLLLIVSRVNLIGQSV